MTTSKRQRWRTQRQQLLFQCVLGAADVWDNKQPVCNFLKGNVCASSLHTGRGRLMSYIPSRKRNFRLAAHKSDSKGCSWRQRCPPPVYVPPLLYWWMWGTAATPLRPPDSISTSGKLSSSLQKEQQQQLHLAIVGEEIRTRLASPSMACA